MFRITIKNLKKMCTKIWTIILRKGYSLFYNVGNDLRIGGIMKKILAGLLVVFAALAVIHVEGRAESSSKSVSDGCVFDKDDLKYEVTKQNNVEVAGFSDKAKSHENLIISEFEVENGGKKYAVTGIKGSSFVGDQKIKGVYIGTIGNKYGNTGFTIGREAFRDCTELCSVSIFKSNTDVQENAFSLNRNNLNSVRSLKVASENISIRTGAFAGFSDVEFSCKQVDSIEKEAFSSTIQNLGLWSDYRKTIREKLTQSGVSVVKKTYEATKYDF